MKTADPSLTQLLTDVYAELKGLDKRRQQILDALEKITEIVSRTPTQDLTRPIKTTNGKKLRVKAVVAPWPSRESLTIVRKKAIAKILPLPSKNIWELTGYLWIEHGGTKSAFSSFIRDHFVRKNGKVTRRRRPAEMRKK